MMKRSGEFCPGAHLRLPGVICGWPVAVSGPVVQCHTDLASLHPVHLGLHRGYPWPFLIARPALRGKSGRPALLIFRQGNQPFMDNSPAQNENFSNFIWGNDLANSSATK